VAEDAGGDGGAAALVRRGLRRLACAVMLTLEARVATFAADREEAVLWQVLGAVLHTNALRAVSDESTGGDEEDATAEAAEVVAAARALSERVLVVRFRSVRALATIRALVAQTLLLSSSSRSSTTESRAEAATPQVSVCRVR